MSADESLNAKVDRDIRLNIMFISWEKSKGTCVFPTRER